MVTIEVYWDKPNSDAAEARRIIQEWINEGYSHIGVHRERDGGIRLYPCRRHDIPALAIDSYVRLARDIQGFSGRLDGIEMAEELMVRSLDHGWGYGVCAGEVHGNAPA